MEELRLAQRKDDFLLRDEQLEEMGNTNRNLVIS